MLRQVFFLFFLLFGLQSCKVVVEDVNGNRLGDIDSINWDSLLSSPGTIPGFSSWVFPPSSFQWPESSFLLPSSSSSVNLSSRVSSSSGESSSSTSSPSSSSSLACDYFTVQTYTKDTLYTWKEVYANGGEEIRISMDTLAYPGTHALPLLWSNNTVPTSPLPEPVTTYEYLCEDSPYYDRADTNGLIRRFSASKDTVYLNFGPEARDPLVEPNVQFAAPDSLRDLLDTIPLWGYQYSRLSILHFRGDSLRITLLGPDWLSVLRMTPQLIQGYTDSCSNDSSVSTTIGFFDDRYYDGPSILAIPTMESEPSTILSWQLRIRNRFGYRDQIRFESFLFRPASCDP